MTIAGYAIGAAEGILYLRASTRTCCRIWRMCCRSAAPGQLLGKRLGKARGLRLRHPHPDGRRRVYLRRGDGADQLVRGLRGDPKNRPPFPAQKGYSAPTIVNNVETLCCVTKILEEGPATFSERGSIRARARSC
jgi:[NiFe] hydrogenase diaphorase moiety large subunit